MEGQLPNPRNSKPTSLVRVGLTPGRILRALLAAESREIRTILIFGIVFALVSMLIPIGAQTVVGLISFGSMTQPLLFLLLVIMAGLLVGAGLRGFQVWLVERWQRRFFVQVAHELVARASTRGPLHGSSKYFFEAVTVQKAGASLLIDGVLLALQAGMGMLLLAFYHPFLLGFNLFLCLAVWFVIR